MGVIQVQCHCAKVRSVPESAVGRKFQCPDCQQTIRIVAAEPIADGEGAADFDANLVIVRGPTHAGDRLLLGGMRELSVGSSRNSQIVLQHEAVAAVHCRLVRVDVEPSRWKLQAPNTNQVFVNGQRVTEQELSNGDTIDIGPYEIRYSDDAESTVAPVVPEMGQAYEPAPQPTAPASKSAGGIHCPSCDKSLAAHAKFCMDCGIDIKTGRPILTSQGVDEDLLEHNARNLIRFISLFVWITPLPMPIRSEAFGTRKPYAIWTIAILTILASMWFFISTQSSDSGPFGPYKNLMLWPSHAASVHIHFDPSSERMMLVESSEFHWYQLLTHAFLHDTSSPLNFIMHLGGNMLFLLVFGTRVNALIGNLATAVLYPILAVCSGWVYMLSQGDSASAHPSLGASGAIMGLAGMYLILFPAHRVFCAMWISFFYFLFRRIFGCVIFPLRGFWVLLIYFGYDVAMSALGSGEGVAHWAHIGGFVTGMIISLGILFSRQFNTRGGDLLSVTLGKNAWPLIGKPSRWIGCDARPGLGIPRAVDIYAPAK